MPYLDKEERFYDYHTSDIEGNNVFDIHKASNSDAQQLLDGSEYWRTHKNTYSEIVEMTPFEYFEACARDCFNEPVSKLIRSRRMDKNTLDHLKQVIQIYKKKFPITYIDYAQHGYPEQEGLHRMMVAGDLFGWDTKFPVQIIKWVDEEKAKEEKEWKHIRKIERYLQLAVERSLRYNYYNIEELKDQLSSEFETEVRYLDEFEGRYFKLELEKVDDDILVVIIDNKYRWEFPFESIHFIDASNKEDIDLEDIDLDDLSDWMKDLLADLENEKKKLNEHHVITSEFLVSDELLSQIEEKFGPDYYKKPLCKEVCEFVADKCPECKMLSFAIAVWKLENYELEPISVKGHCVIKYDNKLYDYTSDQYLKYGITPAKSQPRILEYNEEYSKAFDADIYVDGNYIISA